MENFRFEHRIGKPPSEVYAALTTHAGIQGWWTPDCDVPSQVGEHFKVRFGEMYHTYVVESLVPNLEVRWKCVEHFHNLPGLSEFHEWVGTKLHFSLTPVEGGAILTFEHEGLTSELDCYLHCSERWPFFLGVSLKGYVETGTGQPYVDQEPTEFET